MYNAVSMEVSGKFFGSQRSFARTLVRNATYYPLGKNLVLARQTQFGMILPFAAPAGMSAEENPCPCRKDFSRAAPTRCGASLAIRPVPQSGAPQVPGGPSSYPPASRWRRCRVHQQPNRVPLSGRNIQASSSTDMGNVYSSLSDVSFAVHQKNLTDFNYMVHDVGFGIRYRTPVGPVRVDLAYSINPPSYIGFSGTPAQILNCNPNLKEQR